MYRPKLFLLLIATVAIGACDILQDPSPQQSLPAEGGLTTIGDFESALVGAYNSIQELSTDGDNAAQVIFANDIIADDAYWTGSFPTYVEIFAQEMTANNSSIEDQWNGAYESINAANIILTGLEELNASQSAIDNIRGQALFIRALEYYYLVNYFAKPWGATADNSHLGVPLQLEPVTSQADFQKPARAPVAAVYEQIISDLQEARTLITNTNPAKATANAATALLARIALIQGDWQNAADWAGAVIPDYTLSSSVADYFRTELREESIFEIQNTTQDTPDPANTAITAVYNQGTRDDIQISDAFVQALDNIIPPAQEAALEDANQTATDTRVSILLTGTNSPSDVSQATAADNSTKYEDVVNAADNLPVLRLSEMILTRAEALAELNGVNQESIDLLNQIRTRAITVSNENGTAGNQDLITYSASDFATKQELIDAILLERRVELAFEGHRKTDLQRRHMDVKDAAWNADQLVFPIPLSQMNSNDNMVQNPGYRSE